MLNATEKLPPKLSVCLGGLPLLLPATFPQNLDIGQWQPEVGRQSRQSLLLDNIFGIRA